MAKPPLKLLDAAAGRPRLDRYELIAELAAGGMATVFLARIGGAGGFQRFVAIKRLHPHLAHEQEFVEMFLDEARLAAGIHHPNVVPILEVGESDQGYYLVMEYIEGDTLWNLRAQAKATDGMIDPGVGLRIVIDTLHGLHAAHELRDESGQLLNLVHRDVSPQNVLVGVDGTSRITDFGVARASARLTTTKSGEIKGKLAYMAPEQVKGAEIDRRADVFAMGVVLWEVLANRHLFLGTNDAVTMSRVLFEDIPDIRSVNPRVPIMLSGVIKKALERDAAKRPATCAELADAIERSVKGALPIASGRDVAAAVEKIVGRRVSERREAVQGWLAKTVGDGPTTGVRVPPPLASRSSGSAPTTHPSRPAPGSSQPPSSGVHTPASRRLPPPVPPPITGSGPRPVSGVMSAPVTSSGPRAIGAPLPSFGSPEPPPSPPSIPPPGTGSVQPLSLADLPRPPSPSPSPASRKALWAVPIALSLAGIAGGAWLLARKPAEPTVAVVPTGNTAPRPAASLQPEQAPAQPSPSQPASASPPSTAEPSSSGSVAAPSSSAPPAPKGQGAAPATGKGGKPSAAKPAGGGGDPDDMANNPYHR